MVKRRFYHRRMWINGGQHPRNRPSTQEMVGKSLPPPLGPAVHSLCSKGPWTDSGPAGVYIGGVVYGPVVPSGVFVSAVRRAPYDEPRRSRLLTLAWRIACAGAVDKQPRNAPLRREFVGNPLSRRGPRAIDSPQLEGALHRGRSRRCHIGGVDYEPVVPSSVFSCARGGGALHRPVAGLEESPISGPNRRSIGVRSAPHGGPRQRAEVGRD